MRKRFIGIVTFLIIMCISSNVVFAAKTTGYKYTSSATAGAFKSESEYSLSYSSSYSYVCGGDIGVYYYANSVGLQNSFVRTNRNVYIELYENDVLSSTIVRKYTGSFKTVDGVYRPKVYSTTYTNTSKIEDDGTIELKIKHKVETNTGDTSTSIPAGLLKYKFWTV